MSWYALLKNLIEMRSGTIEYLSNLAFFSVFMAIFIIGAYEIIKDLFKNK